MRIKGILFKEMSDKGVKRYSISMIREIQVETEYFFYLSDWNDGEDIRKGHT